MINEQTVRDYTTRQVFHIAEAAHRGNVTNTVIDRVGGILGALGIDPDMSVSELQRRLRIADRVLSDPAIDLPANISEREAGLFDMGVDATLAWLTRKDDQ